MVSQLRRSVLVGALGSLVVLASIVAAACSPGPTPSPTYVTITPSPHVGDKDNASGWTAVNLTEPPAPTDTPTAAPTPTPVPVAPTITSTTVTESGTAKCGGWTVTFKKPVVSGVATADAMNAAIDSKVTAIVNDFKSNAPTEGAAGPCTLNGQYAVSLASPRLLSLRFLMDEYLGGANDTASASSLNFTVATGAQIGLTSLFSDLPGALGVLSIQSRAELPLLDTMAGVDASWINPGTTPQLVNFDKAWAFSSKGLVVTFAELQVGPVACGTPSVAIPWVDLKTFIDPAGPAAEFAQ